MLRFLLNVLLLRRLIESRTIRRVVLIAFALLCVVVFLYTLNLFLTLPERVNAPHVHAHSSH
jgi:hypothetical protein